jgi:hypothetical protein
MGPKGVHDTKTDRPTDNINSTQIKVITKISSGWEDVFSVITERSNKN